MSTLKRQGVSAVLIFVAALFASGCNSQCKLIDHVVFQPSDNLEVVKVSLVFTSNVKSDLAAAFPIKSYGELFMNPYTAQEPFEIGFLLNTSIVNDQDYVNLQPTTVLPNGTPIGVPYALVQIRGDKPISSKFDIYGYVDVLHQSWLGVAAMFNFMNDQNFPDGLSVSQVFKRDSQGNPTVMGAVFGPVVDSSGNLTKNGGISLFANVKQLLHGVQAGQRVILRPEPGVYLDGQNAANFRSSRKLRTIEDHVIQGLNGNL